MGVVNVVNFGDGFRLEMHFDWGVGLDTASVRCKLLNNYSAVIVDTPAVPVRCLFDVFYIINNELCSRKIKSEYDMHDLSHIHMLMRKRKDRRAGKIDIRTKKEKQHGTEKNKAK